MILHPRHFVRFIDGRAGDVVVVASRPGELGAHLQTLETRLRLRRDYALKLLRRGTDFQELPEIQKTIDRGYCLRSDALHLSFVYIKDPIRQVVFFLLVKTTAARDELWLVTFHRLKGSQLRRRLEAAQILRMHAQEFEE